MLIRTIGSCPLPSAIAEVQEVVDGKLSPFWLMFLGIMGLLIRWVKRKEKKGARQCFIL